MSKKKQMTPEEHNAEAQRRISVANIKDSLETPWTFEWDGKSPPRILDKNGKCVCVLSTGTFEGAYEIEEIISNAKRLISGNL